MLGDSSSAIAVGGLLDGGEPTGFSDAVESVPGMTPVAAVEEVGAGNDMVRSNGEIL